MSATLCSPAVSHPALAMRCILEHKGIDHRVVDLVVLARPSLQPFRSPERRGKARVL